MAKLSFSNQPTARFLLAGALNTLFGYSLFAMLIWLGINSSLSLLITTCAGLIFNFKTIGSFVFKNKDNKLIFRFMFLYFSLYLLNLGLLEGINTLFDNLYYSGIITILLCALVSFYVNKNFIFKKDHAIVPMKFD